jgi:benzylsuccinate CoA-transferase BbsF subunit
MADAPLSGIRIADFTWVWAGPYCTLQLAHMGADVIRIETATRPCVTRMLPPWPGGKASGLDSSGYYNQYNQGKRSLALNFSKPGALEIAKRLVEKSEVVTNNFAHGVMDRLGLGYEELKKIKPGIIMISLSGYGDTGPYRDYVAYGPAQVPLCGLSALTGYSGGPPMHAGYSYADPNAGVHGAFAVLAALYHRELTGEGQYIDMSQWECAMAVLPEGLMEYTMNGREPQRIGNRDPYMAPHGIFRCLDRAEKVMGVTVDQFVAIAVSDDATWRRCASAIGKPELGTDPKFATLAARKTNEDELESIIEGWSINQRAPELARLLQDAGVAAFVVADNKYLSEEDEHLKDRDYFVNLPHPVVGVKQHCGIPWKMSGAPVKVRSAAPTLGQHTDEVLTEVLGLNESEIATLRASGALE